MSRMIACLVAICVIFSGCTAAETVQNLQEGQTKPAPSSESSQQSAQSSGSEASVSQEAASLDGYSTKTQGWGQGKQMDELNCPVSCTQFQNKYGSFDADFIGDTSEKKLMLTFDEGYENGYTPQILDTLREKQVKAVFFVTGDYVERNPDLIERMVQEGHTVGNHTQNHPSMPSLSPDEMAKEINTLGDQVESQFGVKMNMFRPPKGEFSEQSLAVTQQQGYHSVFWSFAYNDWNTDKQPDPATALQTLTERLHPGAIYLLHAVSETNANILGAWIDQAVAQGYRFDVWT